MQLIDPYVGTTANPSAAFLVTTSSSGTTHGVVPYGITTGAGMNISGGAPYENGLDVAACKNCVFNILLIAVDGYSYMQGNSTLTSKITLNLQPGETNNWNTLIDPTAVIFQPATLSSTGSIGSTTALAPPTAMPFTVASAAITPAMNSWTATSSEAGNYIQVGALTCVDVVGTLSVASLGSASGALQFQLPLPPAPGTHDVIGLSVLSGGLVWPAAPIDQQSSVQTTQAVFYPVANQSYGHIGFMASTLNTNMQATTLSVSNIVTGTTYNFGFNGCYQ